MIPYPEEHLDPDHDNGTMPENLASLREAVVGRRIVSAEQKDVQGIYRTLSKGLEITLDDGRKVTLVDTEDCCAFTSLNKFLLHPERVDHVITGVGTTDKYTVWHIYADFGDIMELEVGWSCGNPFYYGYGFDIQVIDPEFTFQELREQAVEAVVGIGSEEDS